MRNRCAVHGRSWLGHVLVAAVMLTTAAACTSPETTDPGPESSSSAVGSTEAPPADSEQPIAEGSEPAATEDPVAAHFSTDPATETGPPAPPAKTAAEVIGGAPDPVQAALVKERLRRSGQDLRGVGIHVFPIAGQRGSLLVISLDDSSGMVAGGGDMDSMSEDFGTALVRSLRSKGVDVEQVALNFTSKDSKGPFVVTMTFEAAQAKRLLSGKGDPGDALRVQVSRGGK